MSARKSITSAIKLILEAPTQLGELLVRAGLIDQQSLDDAAAAAKRLSARLGQLLVMAGYINHRELQHALHAQCLMREQIIDKDAAVRAMQLVREQNISLEQAMETMSEAIPQPSTRLGDLLVEASVVAAEQVERALQESAGSVLLLGRMLVLNGAISDEVLSAALNAQAILRRGGIERADALKAIKRAHFGVPQPTEQICVSLEHAFLAEVLTASRNVPPQVMARAMMEDGDLIDILANKFDIDSQLLAAAREMYSLVEQDMVSKQWCISALSKVQVGALSDFLIESQAETQFIPALMLAELSPPRPPEGADKPDKVPAGIAKAKRPNLAEFLVLCRAITTDQMKRCEAHTDVESALREEVGVTESVVSVAGLCFRLAQESQLSLDEAVFSFQYMNHEVSVCNKPLYEAAEKLAFHNAIWAPYEALTGG